MFETVEIDTRAENRNYDLRDLFDMCQENLEIHVCTKTRVQVPITCSGTAKNVYRLTRAQKYEASIGSLPNRGRDPSMKVNESR